MKHNLYAKFLIAVFLLAMSQAMSAGAGIFLRGDVNGWAASAEWEFVETGNGEFALYDKDLSGAFKIADQSWSVNCNYGANSSVASISMDRSYTLLGGSNPGNISCAASVLHCKQIILTIISDTEATLTLKSNSDASSLQQVYVIGDNNAWDYADSSGLLALTDVSDSIFTGRVTLPAISGTSLSTWNIFQQLGMGGRWGLPDDAEDNMIAGRLTKGAAGKVATTPGTYDFTFHVKTGDFSLQLVESVPTTMIVMPAKATLVPHVPEEVRILSLNNSLINYARQDTVFNHIAASMGKNAIWTSHTNLGKTLEYHWNETDQTGTNVEGQPSAQNMIRMQPWSHIVLQEQTEKPRTNFEGFRASVGKWVDYIRTYCPNPHAVIIMPVNWPLLNDTDHYSDYSRIIQDNYMKVAQEYGIVLAPVGKAYESCFEKEGKEGLATWYRPSEENNGQGQDDRHPSQKSTYMAACVEFGIIFGLSPNDINYDHTLLGQATSRTMRQYAADALESLTQVVDNHSGKISLIAKLYDQFGMELHSDDDVMWEVNGGGSISEGTYLSDGSLGTCEAKASVGDFSAKASITVAETAKAEKQPVIKLNDSEHAETFDYFDGGNKLPQGWRIDRQTSNPRTLGTYALAADTVMYIQGNGNINLLANAKNGTWNFGTDTGRAIGGISTGVANATRCVNVYAHLVNSTGADTVNPLIEYNIKKYRQGANPAGFTVQMYYSADGMSWQKADASFRTDFVADNATQGYEAVPGETRPAGGLLAYEWSKDSHLYLAWNISVTTGTTCNAAMALAVDDFRISAIATGITDCPADSLTVTGSNLYNLSGQKVGKAYKGLVVGNGRKVLLK